MRFQYRIFEPNAPASELNGTMITLGNTVSQSLGGNCGDRGQAVADLTGGRVCAYQRPGTGDDPWEGGIAAGDFPKHTAEFAYELGAILQGEGMQRAVVTSHSADGPFSAGMVAAGVETLPVIAYASTDPVGVRRTTTLGGFIRWSGFRVNQARGKYPVPETPAEWKAPPERSLPQLLKDMRRNRLVWSAPCFTEALGRIAVRTDVAVRVIFPEYSFNGKHTFMREVAANLDALGGGRAGYEAPYSVLYVPGIPHSLFDDPRFAGGVVLDALADAGYHPEQFAHPMYQEDRPLRYPYTDAV